MVESLLQFDDTFKDKKMISVSRSPCVIVRGNFSEGNFGDDALLLAAHELVSHHYANEQILYDCAQLAYKKDEVQFAHIANVDDLWRADAIVYGGGTQFFSFSDDEEKHRSIFYRIIDTIYQPNRILTSIRTRRRFRRESKLPKIGVGLGFGPFVGNSPATQAACLLASRMLFIWVRDEASRKFCEESGIHQVFRGPDLCFLPVFQEKHILHRTLIQDGNSAQIGIILRDWKYGNQQNQTIDSYLKLAILCRERSMSVNFFIFSPDQDKRVLSLLQTAGENVVSWSPTSMRIVDYVKLLGTCSIFVTQRFHGAIFALLMGKPFVAVDVEPKLKLVAELYGCNDVLADADEAPAGLFQKVNNTLHNFSKYEKQARTVRDEQTRMAIDAQTAFDAVMRKIATSRS